MLRECEICGGFHESDNPNRKYCDDCAAHTEARRREYENAVRDNKRRMCEPDMYKGKCSQCGEEFITLAHRVIRKDDAEFCSEKCRKQWVHDHAICQYCGKSLKDNPYYDPDRPSTMFCSDECKAAKKREDDIAKGHLHKCEWCGKEFVRKTGRFCSKECYLEALRHGWRPESDKAKGPKTVLRRERCVVCGKPIVHEYKLPLPQSFPPHVCSPECQEKYRKMHQKKK